MSTVIGPNVAFVHMPKTAGTWISRLLIAHGVCPKLAHENPHPYGRDLDLTGRLVIGCIRDPWSWYLSLLRYGMHNRATYPGHGMWLEPFIQAVGTDEKALIQAMLYPQRLCSDSPYFVWSDDEPDRSSYLRASLKAYWPECVVPRREECLADVLVSTDSAGLGLLQALSAWQLPEAMVEECLRPYVPSARLALDSVYDSDLIDAVAERESWALEMFGFEYGRPSPPCWEMRPVV
jgi:hypothetical protein